MRRVGLAACSDGQLREWGDQNRELCDVLREMGVEVVPAEHIYAKTDVFSGSDSERAQDLMRFYRDESVEAIFDISGGDLANGVLKHLDWDVIAASNKMFWGYSDLTTVINAIYAKTGRASALYQIKNLVYSKSALQRKRFENHLRGTGNDLFDIKYEFLQGKYMEGVVAGGNIRCLLKLAGTEYMPDMTDKILVLEAYGGKSGVIAAAFNQLDLMGVFGRVAGILLGTFTKYEEDEHDLSVFDLLKMHIPEDIPVAQTSEIGHGEDSKAIVIGRKMCFGD